MPSVSSEHIGGSHYPYWVLDPPMKHRGTHQRQGSQDAEEARSSRTTSTSRVLTPPRLTPRTFCWPYGNPESIRACRELEELEAVGKPRDDGNKAIVAIKANVEIMVVVAFGWRWFGE